MLHSFIHTPIHPQVTVRSVYVCEGGDQEGIDPLLDIVVIWWYRRWGERKDNIKTTQALRNSWKNDKKKGRQPKQEIKLRRSGRETASSKKQDKEFLFSRFSSVHLVFSPPVINKGNQSNPTFNWVYVFSLPLSLFFPNLMFWFRCFLFFWAPFLGSCFYIQA